MTLAQYKRRWDKLCRRIERAVPPPPAETTQEQQQRLQHLQHNYAAFVHYYFPHYATAPTAGFHILAAQQVLANPNYHGIWEWFRSAGKSVHANLLVPLWLLFQQPPQLHTFLLVGRSEATAQRLLQDLRAELAANQRLRHDYGPQLSANTWDTRTATHFVTRSGAGFFAIGMGQSPRGLRNGAHRPDYIVADDLDHQALSRNPHRVRAAAQWLVEEVLGTLDAGRGRFLFVNNRFSNNSLLDHLKQTGAYGHLRVNALDEQGLPTWPEKYGAKGEWLQERRRVLGYRAFQREYMNEPVEEGALFKADWLQWKPALPWAQYEDLLCYIDPSYSHTPRADYKAAKLWGRAGHEYHLLRAFVRQAPLPELVRWCHALQLEAGELDLSFYMEANLLQDFLLDEFRNHSLALQRPLLVRPDTRRKPAKLLRLEAITALWETGSVYLDESQRHNQDMQTGIDQLLALEPGSTQHDDGPDADEGALWLLRRRQPRPTPRPIIGLRSRVW